MDPIEKAKRLLPLKNPFSLVEEFKNFAFRGNVIDLAIGVIIGGAFGKQIWIEWSMGMDDWSDIRNCMLGIVLAGGKNNWIALRSTKG